MVDEPADDADDDWLPLDPRGILRSDREARRLFEAVIRPGGFYCFGLSEILGWDVAIESLIGEPWSDTMTAVQPLGFSTKAEYDWARELHACFADPEFRPAMIVRRDRARARAGRVLAGLYDDDEVRNLLRRHPIDAIRRWMRARLARQEA